jgi:3',5'-cyclic AMP phosphodiesterase CpdA
MLRLAILGDVHYANVPPRDSSILLHHSPVLLERALDQIVRHPARPDLVIQIGDLIDGQGQSREQTRADLEAAVALFDATRLRWTWILGNHDVTYAGGRQVVMPHLRRPRAYGEIILGHDVLLLLDSTCPAVYGRVAPGQQAWLEEAIARHGNRRVFVFIHHVFDWSLEDDMYIEGGDALRALLIGAPAVKAVFMGHAHTHRIDTTDGLHEIVTSALCGWPLSFRWVEIDGGRLRTSTEQIAGGREIEEEARIAFEMHPHIWRPTPRNTDVEADLPLRP